MKSMTIKGWLLATFFLSASQGSIQAQIVVGPPTFDSVSIPSTGGITYFVFSATVPDLRLDPGRPGRALGARLLRVPG
jgi:hypothetical protein